MKKLIKYIGFLLLIPTILSSPVLWTNYNSGQAFGEAAMQFLFTLPLAVLGSLILYLTLKK